MAYNPNHIPKSERIMNLLFSSILLIYGTFGLVVDDIYIPGKRGPGIHYHGIAAWVIYAAFLCAIANMISVVIDHYDKRNNERNYKLFARISQIIGWIFFGLSLFLKIYLKK